MAYSSLSYKCIMVNACGHHIVTYLGNELNELHKDVQRHVLWLYSPLSPWKQDIGNVS